MNVNNPTNIFDEQEETELNFFNHKNKLILINGGGFVFHEIIVSFILNHSLIFN